MDTVVITCPHPMASPLLQRSQSAPATVPRARSQPLVLACQDIHGSTRDRILQLCTDITDHRLFDSPDLEIINDISCMLQNDITEFVHYCGGDGVISHYDATGEVSYQSVRLVTSDTFSLRLNYMHSGSRSITTMMHSMDQVVVVLRGKLERKLVRVEPQSFKPPHNSYYKCQHWDAEACVSNTQYVQTVDNCRLRIASKNELTPLHPMIVHEEVACTFKEDAGDSDAGGGAGTLFLSFEALRLPSGDSTVPHLTYMWTDGQQQPGSMAGPPASESRCFSWDDQSSAGFQRMLHSCTAVRLHSHVSAQKSAHLTEIYRNAMRDAVRGHCDALHATVSSRQGERLSAQDMAAVRCIGDSVLVYVADDGMLDSSRKVEAILNEGHVVMWRYILYDSASLQLRIHLFPSSAETYVHTHRNNFISMALYGQYVHHTWLVHPDVDDSDEADSEPDKLSCLSSMDETGSQQGAKGVYYERVRNSDGNITEPKKCCGRLAISSSFLHSPQHAYFLDRASPHTVSVREHVLPGATSFESDLTSSAPPSPQKSYEYTSGSTNSVFGNDSRRMVSLFVKDKAPNPVPTKVFEQSVVVGGEGIKEGSEIELTGEEKLAVLYKMQSYLQQSFRDVML